jgi:hypothetical protein
MIELKAMHIGRSIAKGIAALTVAGFGTWLSVHSLPNSQAASSLVDIRPRQFQ